MSPWFPVTSPEMGAVPRAVVQRLQPSPFSALPATPASPLGLGLFLPRPCLLLAPWAKGKRRSIPRAGRLVWAKEDFGSCGVRGRELCGQREMGSKSSEQKHGLTHAVRKDYGTSSNLYQ